MKRHVGSLRLRVREGAMTPEEIESHLDQREQVIDAAAALAQDVRAGEASNSALRRRGSETRWRATHPDSR
jgi:hypothetical protein